ncbi:MAG TPA: ATP-binding protein [Vicinamibacterales bacterium]|nr:ATP-binding protein [Vicinamibacterales bacterium]
MPLKAVPVRDRGLVLLAAALTLGIFILDLTLPLGAVTGMLYIFVILLGLWIRWPSYPYVAAAVAWALLVVDTALNWTEQRPAIIFFNRPLMTLMFWVTAALVMRYSRIERASEAYVRQLADLKYALDQAAIVATTDVSGEITYVNDKFCEISKYSREELLGQDHRIINSGSHPKEFFRDLWRTIARGQVWQGEILNRAKDGSPYWVDTTIVPFVDDRNRPYQYTAIRNDITGRKQMESRLREQAALARVGQMAAVVAHEVRNPLAGIKGAMQVLAARRAEGDPEAPVMRDIVSRVDSLSELINDLLLFARPTPPRMAKMAIRPVLEDAAATARRDPAAERVEIAVSAPEAVIDGDYELLKALFLNLFLNSAQAMQGRGRIEANATARAGDVRIAVRDFGPGIPDAVAAQMFEPFFTTKTRGGGLGLAIARRTAELHGGSLTYVRPEDGGAEMIVTLAHRPLVTDASARIADEHGD